MLRYLGVESGPCGGFGRRCGHDSGHFLRGSRIRGGVAVFDFPKIFALVTACHRHCFEALERLFGLPRLVNGSLMVDGPLSFSLNV